MDSFMDAYRVETDSLGEVRVPAHAYWGAQTQRAIENFQVSGIRFPRVFIRSLGLVKVACSRVNQSGGLLKGSLAEAIAGACREIIEGALDDHFPLDIFQTGSGTSTNMNINEVVATRANEVLTGARHGKSPVHPNDHVNMGQSSNDVFPTAIHVAACLQTNELLLPSLEFLRSTLKERSAEFGHVVKTGRTHLMDAMPVTLGQEISGWEAEVGLGIERIRSVLPRLSELALGGTAVGSGINTLPGFGAKAAKVLGQLTGLPFTEARNHFAAQAGMGAVLELSGQIRASATGIMKIANDLRHLNSGPVAGLCEIQLPPLQPGSSIMPGKINPVIPEAVRMASVQVIGCDTAISLSNGLGDFELNVMLPVICHNILQSITILGNASRLLAEKAIRGFTVNESHIAELLGRNPVLATVLAPVIGYDKTAEVVKRALRERKTVKEIVVDMGYLSEAEAKKLLDPSKMTRPGFAD